MKRKDNNHSRSQGAIGIIKQQAFVCYFNLHLIVKSPKRV